MIISMEYKDIKGVLVWISQKDSSVAPFSLVISFFLFFLFFSIFCGLNGSFYLTLICPLWDLLLCPLWIFSSLKGNTLFYKKVKEIFHTLQGARNHKEHVTIMMYAMYASASVAEYAIILARHVAMIRARPH